MSTIHRVVVLGLRAALVCVIAAVLSPAVVNAAQRQVFAYSEGGCLYRQDLNGSGRTVLASVAGRDIRWAPGERYALLISGRWDLSYEWVNPVILDARTGKTVTIKDSAGEPFPEEAGVVRFGGWSADGSRFSLVVSSLWADPLITPRVHIFDTVSGRSLGSVTCETDSNAALSPDGTRVLYSWGGEASGNTLWMYNITAGTDSLWASAEQLDIEYEGGYVVPYWPAGGSQIVANIEDWGSRRHVHVITIDPTSKAIREVPSQAGWIDDVTPDGRYALIESQLYDDYGGVYQVGLLDLNTGVITPTVHTSAFGDADWIARGVVSPDGVWVLLETMSSDPSVAHRIWKIRVDGSSRARVAYGSAPAFLTDVYQPNPYGWSIRNGVDKERIDDWVVWERVFGGGAWSWMRYDRQNGDSVKDGHGLFEGGNCYGMAASSLVNFAKAGNVDSFPVSKRVPYYGLWSLVSAKGWIDPDDNYVRVFSSTTEPSMREYIEAFQLVQARVPDRGHAWTTALEAVRRIDAGEFPPVIAISTVIDGSYRGHALVPYSYERPDASTIELLVYDCNHPGEAGRRVFVYSNDSWAYNLGWTTWSGVGESLTWNSPTDILGVSGGFVASSLVAAEAQPLPVWAGFSNARALVTDASAHRVGYVGTSLVREVTGAKPSYPDAVDPSGIVSSFALPQVSLTGAAMTPLATGPMTMTMSDSDSVVDANISGLVGVTDRIVVNGSLDSVAVEPASGCRTVSLWAGSWASGGSVKFGALDATTTAGDLVLSATPSAGHLENRSAGTKWVKLAVMGSGWVGRRTASVSVPAGGFVDFSATTGLPVGSSQVRVAVNGGIAATVKSLVMGTSRAVILPPASTSYQVATTIRAQTAESALPASQARLEVSSDGKRWSSLGSFATRGTDGNLLKSIKLSRNVYLRVRVLSSDSRQGSVSATERIYVRPYVRTPIAPSTMSRYASYTVYGYLKPRHASGSYPVRIYKYRYVGGEWKAYGYVKAKASNYSSYTKYSVRVKLTAKGRWRLRAYAPADTSHASTWSRGYDYVTVK